MFLSPASFCYDVAVVQGILDSRLSSEEVRGNYCSERVGVGRVSARPDGSVINDEASGAFEFKSDEAGKLAVLVNPTRVSVSGVDCSWIGSGVGRHAEQ
jgi:hypothetical protein